MNSRNRGKETAPRKVGNRALLLCFHFTWVFVALVAILSAGYLPNSINLEAGQVSPTTIKADRTLEIINERDTEASRRQAAAQVEPVYSFDQAAALIGEQKLKETFSVISQMAAVKRNKPEEEANRELERLKQGLPVAFSQDTLDTLINAQPETLMLLETNSRHVFWRVMDSGIRADNMDAARLNVAEAAEEMLGTLPQQYTEAVVEIASEALVPNKNPDYEATMKAEQEAMAAVKPITTVIPEGFVVIREGEIVTHQQIQALEALGIHKPSLNLQRVSGYSLLVLCLMSLVIYYLRREQPEIFASDKKLVLIGLVVVVIAVAARFLTGLSPYLAPVAAASILMTVLLEVRLALMITAFLGLFVGALVQSMPAAAVGIITGVAGVLALVRVNHRSNLIGATVTVMLANTLGVLVFSLIVFEGWQNTFTGLMYGAFNGLLSASIAVGVLPTLEYFFGITTHLRLLDLSNPCEPLLQRLLKEAPGTYQHSIMVGNLAESAAQAIGADALLCKVGAYYHDIGKMKRPRFFVENQMGAENPHDRLAPSLSTLIILSHVKDGIELARQNKLPDILVGFIAEHHGTNLVAYFYHQACSHSNEPVYEEDFRYPGPKPQSRETAILMLSDGLEAAARTLSNPTHDKIDELVNKMVKQCLDDGQLDECDLSLKDINLLRESFVRSLQNIYHARIEYPEPSSLPSARRKKVTSLRKKA